MTNDNLGLLEVAKDMLTNWKRVTPLLKPVPGTALRLESAISAEESRRKKEAEDRELMQRVVAIFLSAKEALDRPLPLTMPHDPFWREWRRTAGEVAADLSRLCDMEGR